MARDENLWLSFRGVRSDAAGARVLRLPAPPAAAARGAKVVVPGRDGALWQADGGSEGLELKARLKLNAGSDRESVAAWLSGAGPLVLSFRPTRYYRARIVREVEFRRDDFGPGSWTVEVTFDCQPFQYLLDEAAVELAAPGVFPGQGTAAARPAITVYGSGEITLMVNDCTVLLTDVADAITVDCELMMGLKDGANQSPKITLLGGGDDGWPELQPGGESNAVSWTGGATRVSIQPRWRWR